jgi:hypothetical protein
MSIPKIIFDAKMEFELRLHSDSYKGLHPCLIMGVNASCSRLLETKFYPESYRFQAENL